MRRLPNTCLFTLVSLLPLQFIVIGLWSGFMPFRSDKVQAGIFVAFQINVTSDEPHWFYAAGQCRSENSTILYTYLNSITKKIYLWSLFLLDIQVSDEFRDKFESYIGMGLNTNQITGISASFNRNRQLHPSSPPSFHIFG